MNDRAGVAACLSAGEPAAGLGDADPQQAAAIAVDRACTELRRGRPLALRVDADRSAGAAIDAAAGGTPAGWRLLAAVETLSEARWHRLARLGAPMQLLLSAERLRAIGRPGAVAPLALALKEPATIAQLQQWAAVTPGTADPARLGEATAADPAMQAALALCKRARLLPALVTLLLPPGQDAALAAAQVLQFDPAAVALAAPAHAGALRRVSDARVPLAAHEDCTLVLFRELDGDAEHVAIVVGRPDAWAEGEPVPVRLHSACLTGDLLGSLRCDCGPQLQRAIERLAETGGVLLYLAQEGRGTGLANKLRAYRLQDGGLDTLQADRHLGFREDERDFLPAAAMLRALGLLRIRLLTNNPRKIEALRGAGIDVVDRLPLHGPVNRHNARYIATKQQQGGHLGADD